MTLESILTAAGALCILTSLAALTTAAVSELLYRRRRRRRQRPALRVIRGANEGPPRPPRGNGGRAA